MTRAIRTSSSPALGHAYGPKPERGVFHTTDGGKNWEKVLFVDESAGCSDLAMDPNNPRILFARTWQLAIHTRAGRAEGRAAACSNPPTEFLQAASRSFAAPQRQATPYFLNHACKRRQPSWAASGR